MKSKIHYNVKAKLIRYKTADDINFLEFNELFENDNPILAREAAFNFYQNYIDVLLESRGVKYDSDKQAREELQSFIHQEPSIVKFGEKDIDFGESVGNGIGVFVVFDQFRKTITGEMEQVEEQIHGIGRLVGFSYNTDSVILNLNEEFEEYTKLNYDIAGKERTIIYCSQVEWEEGYLGNGEWKENYKEPDEYKILETPFDWAGHDKPYWWGEPHEEKITVVKQKNSKSINEIIEEIIEGGEGEQVEFKPALLYNFKTKAGGISIMAIIAKTICSFLNSKGGLLLIGLKDDGKTQGLDYDFSLANGKDPKDFFKLEFDKMLERFLSFSVKPMVNSDFYERESKLIFVVKVEPSKNRPIFMKGHDNPKEFWVRGNGSSRQLTDVEAIINYWLDRGSNM